MIASRTLDQSPATGWRNRRTQSYHGVSPRLCIQRHSGQCGSRIKVGLPSAAARWATLVSTVITMSSWSTRAAVSA